MGVLRGGFAGRAGGSLRRSGGQGLGCPFRGFLDVRRGRGGDAVGVAGTRLTIDLEVERGEDSPRGRVDTKATRDFVVFNGTNPNGSSIVDPRAAGFRAGRCTPRIWTALAQGGRKGDDMALFLQVHELDTHEPEALVAAWTEAAGSRIRCLKHWVGDNAIALLMEAPNEDSLRSYDSDAGEVTRLFASAQRWLSYETIHLGRAGRRERLVATNS
jgi:hypothetical protein